ncbi:hypothetical protein BU24DRAFT_126896 [Aaosphaeria arxii CBS 175.79]|uniref:Uncharacterized protein n=1 Tax=Aaosphaeria arxii CBS 175.79 TaxID=1450172 RepID=A0A6A5Y4Q0_9PLEO|nr:uncharacterized protein BU24DRAFT_126896 [Aaosphaeria arxii CBS 175.79]KAF2019770.1 hypothetical protein BU24DRAFT_126896 [Aaosphaeria arxii CBS 175.79]
MKCYHKKLMYISLHSFELWPFSSESAARSEASAMSSHISFMQPRRTTTMQPPRYHAHRTHRSATHEHDNSSDHSARRFILGSSTECIVRQEALVKDNAASICLHPGKPHTGIIYKAEGLPYTSRDNSASIRPGSFNCPPILQLFRNVIALTQDNLTLAAGLYNSPLKDLSRTHEFPNRALLLPAFVRVEYPTSMSSLVMLFSSPCRPFCRSTGLCTSGN